MKIKNKVLLVDDDPIILQLVREILMSLDEYEITSVASGEEALEKLHDFVPDLLLLDIQLPGIDGYAVCRKIRADSRFRFVKIIMLSGMAMIQAGMADVILCGGTEHMSSVPYSAPGARWGCRLQDQTFVDNMIHALHCGSHVIPHPEDGPVDETQAPLKYFVGKPYIMGHTAEFIAQHLDISREEMDEVALRSHNQAERATNDGSFADEIVPVEVPRRKKPPLVFDRDEHFRPGLTLEQLQKLPPAFVPKTGKVTAGNSSGINDGSSAMVIMSADKARDLGIQPLARIRATGRGACHPSVMGLSPVPAVRNLLEKNPVK